jgi:hypothetical protein
LIKSLQEDQPNLTWETPPIEDPKEEKTGEKAFITTSDISGDNLRLEGRRKLKLDVARKMALMGYPREERLAVLGVTLEEFIDLEKEIQPPVQP